MIMELNIKWKSPSNLAIIKYWGKKDKQIPQNPSISLTLENAHTITQLVLDKKDKRSKEVELEFFFHGAQNEKFKDKLVKLLTSIADEYPLIHDYKLVLRSENTFPHSSGIASSASSMSALALCLVEADDIIKGKNAQPNDDDFLRRSSFLARLFSGSASRSVYPYLSVWGRHPEIVKSSDEYAIPYHQEAHEIFKTYHDDILIVSKEEKSVSSTAGHQLMNGNAFAEARYIQANERLKNLLPVLRSGDVESFGQIAENEALTLHALMMCSEPSYILMKENTLKMIELIRNYRLESKLPVYFSLDAGPNIHLLYPELIAARINEFVHHELSKYCADGQVLRDKAGMGPQRLVS